MRKHKHTSILTSDEINVTPKLSFMIGMAHEILQPKFLDDSRFETRRNPRRRRWFPCASSTLHSGTFPSRACSEREEIAMNRWRLKRKKPPKEERNEWFVFARVVRWKAMYTVSGGKDSGLAQILGCKLGLWAYNVGFWSWIGILYDLKNL